MAAPIPQPTRPPTTEPSNISANAGFWFTDTQVTIYNNSDGTPADAFGGDFTTFDFIFTNEDITGVSIDGLSSSDFLPATLTLVGQNEFKVDIGTGVDPSFLSTLVIDVTTGGVSRRP